ncbi:Rieske 2Fe-2S domain-containing protein [Caulobacter mirabilis]|uniref:Rieske domain-containing protein n=1 Tax=Caulobacter mirabilis TaxID=69666 RepID=A0A2D2B1L0_9CAUL|nr:Rieske 2Fe-2S domain-containing protein [Caulobacter mirabilis]ATQ44135.1 hypothetical protein CSW64_17950 [Caulobacter mirabilis]
MYPFDPGVYAARNRWYVAALSSEIGRTPMERWILNKPVAFYRTEAGTPVAIGGRCPHRGYPLGKSQLRGDAVVCGYHGMTFEADGRCSHIPCQDVIAPNARVKAYPLIELWDWVWIWPGDPERADPALIPDHFELGLTDPAWKKRPPMYWPVNGRYQLLNDNLLDLSHLTVLHASTIGGADVAATQETHEEGGGWVRSTRYIEDAFMTDWSRQARGIEGKVDREIGMTFLMPGLHHGHDRFYRPRSEATGANEPILEVRVFHAVTPATLTTCHYFAASAVDPTTHEIAARTQPDPKATMRIFLEDIEATNEIERLLQTAGEFKELPLRSDVHGLRGRRMLQAMIKAEQAA